MPQGTKVRTKKIRTSASKKTYYIRNKEEHKVNKCCSHPKMNKKDHLQPKLTDHASPNLSVVVSEVNLTTSNKDW